MFRRGTVSRWRVRLRGLVRRCRKYGGAVSGGGDFEKLASGFNFEAFDDALRAPGVAN